MSPWQHYPAASIHHASRGLSAPSLKPVLFLSPNQRRGVIAMAVASFISCVFVSFLLLYIAVSSLVESGRQKKIDSPIPFIRRQIAAFVVCLLVADLIQSLSGVLQVKWAAENKVYDGVACTTQAVALTMGDLGSTVWSCVISAHTFSSIALGRLWSRGTIVATVIFGWAFVLVSTIIGPAAFQTSHDGPFFGIAGDWCFITSNYGIHRLVIHYVPLFIAAVLIPVFYGLVFLVLRGKINFMRQVTGPSPLEDAFLRERVVIAKRMLLYPVAYLTCISPITIVRLIGLKNNYHIPDDAWAAAVFILFLLGAVDSVIYATTRKLVSPIRLSSPFRRRSTNEPALTAPRDAYRHTCKPSHRSDTLELTQYDSRDKGVADFPQYEREVKPGTGPGPGVSAIHVTLERMEVVR